MDKTKLRDNLLNFLYKYYDYSIILLVISFSGYIEYLYENNYEMWLHTPCMIIEINNFLVGAVGYEYYQLFNLNIPFFMLIFFSYVIFVGLYHSMRTLYKYIKNRKIKLILLVSFYLFLVVMLIIIYLGCGIRYIG